MTSLFDTFAEKEHTLKQYRRQDTIMQCLDRGFVVAVELLMETMKSHMKELNNLIPCIIAINVWNKKHKPLGMLYHETNT